MELLVKPPKIILECEIDPDHKLLMGIKGDPDNAILEYNNDDEGTIACQLCSGLMHAVGVYTLNYSIK